jgi:hypothetical protein
MFLLPILSSGFYCHLTFFFFLFLSPFNWYFNGSPEYTAAIERKQVQQQVAERQKFVVERSRQESLAAFIRIEGETEAGRMITEAMRISPEYLELRKIEASKRIAEYLARSRNIVYVPNNGSFLLNLPTNHNWNKRKRNQIKFIRRYWEREREREKKHIFFSLCESTC